MRISDWSSDVCSSDLAGGEVVVAGQRADREVSTFVAHIGEVAQPADVDDHRWRGESELHERQQRVSAREQLGFVTVASERRDRCLGAVGPLVLEGERDHACDPSARSEEHTSELTSLMRISYAVFCLKT